MKTARHFTDLIRQVRHFNYRDPYTVLGRWRITQYGAGPSSHSTFDKAATIMRTTLQRNEDLSGFDAPAI
jgi:hypothetical protein